MVGVVFLSVSTVVGLGGSNGPVAVDRVLNGTVDLPVLAEDRSGVDRGLVGELIVDAGPEIDGIAVEAIESLLVLAVAIDGLEGVVDAVLKLLVAANHELGASQVSASPVEGGLILGVVDELREDVLLHIPVFDN